MTVLVPLNHPVLHSVAEEITAQEIESGVVKKLIKDMKVAIASYDVGGFTAVAIAAPQIGVAKRLFLVSDQSDDKNRLPSLVAINPHIIKHSKKSCLVGEGCLSVPNCYGEVKRYLNVTLRALDENGQEFERGAGGLLAQIIQHECNHLDGILFTDCAEKVWDRGELKDKSLSEKND